MFDLLKAALKTGAASVINILFGILKTKIVAMVLGPSGMGLLSLLDQVMQTVLSLANFGGGVAITQGIANRTGQARARYMATVFWILTLSGGMAAIVLVAFAEKIAPLFKMQGYADLIRWLAVPVVLGVVLGYLNSTLNGNCSVGRMAIVTVATSGLILLLVYPAALLTKAGYPVAYIAMVSVAAGGSMLLALVFTWRNGWLRPLWQGLRQPLSLEAARHFFSISGTTIVLGLMTTGVFLILRSELAIGRDYTNVGLFDAAWRVSMTYVTLVLGSFGSYYMPRLSGLRDDAARDRLMGQAFRLVTLVMTPLVIGVIEFKPLIVRLLYSAEFLKSLTMMRWMLIGDYLKVASWVFATPALAYADMKIYFSTETFWNLGFLGLSLYSLRVAHDFQGVGASFMLLYLVYLMFYVYYSAIKHSYFQIRKGALVSWLIGLGLVVGVSILSWEDTNVSWARALVCVSVAIGYAAISINGDERGKLGALVRNAMSFGRVS